MKKNLEIKLIILFIMTFFFGHNVFAASLDLNIEKNTVKQDEIFTLNILLNSDGQLINTLEGDLKYDPSLIKAEAIDIGNSFINFWVEKPGIDNAGIIHFSGITPGGILTTKSEAFKVIFRAQKTGQADITLNNTSLFLNDGKGTLVKAKIGNIAIKIIENKDSNKKDVTFDDKLSPEKFNIIRTSDSSLFDNKSFIVFSTTDKGSGVSYYKICEIFKCSIGESPFLLKNQTPFYRIVVKAYDMNGNVISSSLTSIWFTLLVIVLSLGILGLCLYFYRKYFALL